MSKLYSELAQQLRMLDSRRVSHSLPGASGQILGNEGYRIVGTGFSFSCLHEAADALDEAAEMAYRLNGLDK